ncbi:MAG: hypothetical protein KJP01_03055 [Gramella sp.]|nr:hypothetical protein [Christiangramia sp.]
MENEKYLQDLTEIKNMMNRSSRFISLSGLSGVFAGIYAIMGAIIARIIMDDHGSNFSRSILDNSISPDLIIQLSLVAAAVLILALGTAVFLTTRKAKTNTQKVWDSTTRRLLINFFAPLIAGGLFCLVMLQYNLIGFILPCMLIFYGLALINGSKFTFGDLKGLGYANVVLGLIATQFPEYGLFFWAAGFGVFHIIYGIWMYNKYDRKSA